MVGTKRGTQASNREVVGCSPEQLLLAMATAVHGAPFVRVRGRVTRVDEHGKYAYGDIQDVCVPGPRAKQVSYRWELPCDRALKLGNHVEIEGAVAVLPGSFYPGLDVQIHGERVEEWAPPPSPEPPLELQRTLPIRGLLEVVREFGEESVAIVGSSGMKHDLFTRTGRLGRYEDVRVENVQEISEAIERFADDGQSRAIAFVRGGGPQAGLMVWDERGLVKTALESGLHIFTALGHAHDVHLMDKYADEMFSTPTTFGDRLSTCMKLIEDEQELQETLAERGEKLQRFATRLAEQTNVARAADEQLAHLREAEQCLRGEHTEQTVELQKMGSELEVQRAVAQNALQVTSRFREELLEHEQKVHVQERWLRAGKFAAVAVFPTLLLLVTALRFPEFATWLRELLGW